MNLDQLMEFVKERSPLELEKAAEQLTIEQIPAVITKLSDVDAPRWDEKTKSIVLGFTDREKLETSGKALTLHQLLHLMNTILQIEDKHHWKLSPLLVGLPHRTFEKLLTSGSDNDLHILKHESVTEPVQHQLTLISHELNYRLNEKIEKTDDIEKEIETLDLETQTWEETTQMKRRIRDLSQAFQHDYTLSNIALGIAWNTNRLDLIETLNHIKDSCYKYLSVGIGKPSLNKAQATGLFLKLENKLFSIYSNSDHPHGIDALNDDEPAIEGLAKFSVWYLRDYFALGLLPGIKSVEDLDVDMKGHSETERAEYREKLFALAKQTLEKYGLKTVADLKRESIFSKKTLQEYLESTLGIVQI